MYNLKSKIAEEFINHEEIIESIEYGKKNERAKPQRSYSSFNVRIKR